MRLNYSMYFVWELETKYLFLMYEIKCKLCHVLKLQISDVWKFLMYTAINTLNTDRIKKSVTELNEIYTQYHLFMMKH
jgi:hypothetical protein